MHEASTDRLEKQFAGGQLRLIGVHRRAAAELARFTQAPAVQVAAVREATRVPTADAQRNEDRRDRNNSGIAGSVARSHDPRLSGSETDRLPVGIHTDHRLI